MGKPTIELPSEATLMVSNRDYRLSTLTGWCQLFKANVPALVPPHAYIDAIQAGIIVAGPVVTTAPTITVDPVVEDDEVDSAQRSTEIDQAVMIVLTRNDPDDFKADNTPKVNKVIAELDPSFVPRPTATEIAEAHERLQENLDLAED